MHQPFSEWQKSYTVSTSTSFVAFEFIIGGIVNCSINMNKKTTTNTVIENNSSKKWFYIFRIVPKIIAK
jgi:hypothetical protein